MDKTGECVFTYEKYKERVIAGGVHRMKAISSVNYLENFHKIINVLEVLGIVQTENSWSVISGNSGNIR